MSVTSRLNPRHQDCVREKIRATQIVNTLQNHIDGKLDLKPTQVTAAIALLKKCVPDLTATSFSGEVSISLGALLEKLPTVAPRGSNRKN